MSCSLWDTKIKYDSEKDEQNISKEDNTRRFV